MQQIIEKQWTSLTQAVTGLGISLPDLEKCIGLITDCMASGGKIMAAGNGGSACDALHLCEELVGRYRDNRRALPAICLSADATTLTCIGNDFGFDQIFSRQVEALSQPGDVLVLFTSSGNSQNLLNGVETARSRGVKTVVFSGRDGGKLAGKADAEWIVPSDHGARVQEMHTWALHVTLEILEARLLN